MSFSHRKSHASFFLAAGGLAFLVSQVFYLSSIQILPNDLNLPSAASQHDTAQQRSSVPKNSKRKAPATSLHPYVELQSFLKANPDSPGARFVQLLRAHLHSEPGIEVARYWACRPSKNTFAMSFCTAGYRASQEALEGMGDDADTKMVSDKKRGSSATAELDAAARVPIAKVSVYNVTHYVNGEPYRNLGTTMACLPLLLAGYAATADESTKDNSVVELGPYLGFSTRCIAYGMQVNRQQKSNKSKLFVYDSYHGQRNYKAIYRSNKWIANHPQFHQFSSTNNDFLPLWKYGTDPVCKDFCVAQQGYIDHNTFSPAVVGSQPISLLTIDSVKSNQGLYDQLRGMGTFPAGSILFLMDFTFVFDQIQLIYACLREDFLLPVYVSWNMEHMAFVATRDIDFGASAMYECYNRRDWSIEDLQWKVRDDLLLLSGLTDDPIVHDQFKEVRERQQEALMVQLAKPARGSISVDVHPK